MPRLFETKCRTPRFESAPTRGIYTVGSEQASLRHTLQFAYCCFRQDLTGFTTQHCTGPIHQHRPMYSIPCREDPQRGIQPRYSGLRVTGHR